ncbi:MAG: branched-chain amino acid ABC transporter substrate-binding protein [Humidesulfovibrio sp.]|jgi:branched-chain amino acid transport system substrate-binding protein|uniref:branched-chain amino acid ABC transporter substrate-binding protein n=1 Tax=Humidesulfovibrio sp. TaxID=2910988 RepID=UPI002732792D|nr:branched-chain amino acid ABC transporter substrate-binding protein [Humidesulfovibrio sp.]MDP2846702.1 branched-chain amino acid ABC transporter substrate-binding protein [Humidesulfovibrio sp.]
MKRALYLLSMLLLVSLVAFGCGGEKKEEKKGEAPKAAAGIKIGSLGPLTGPYAADGNDIKNGVLAAIEVMNPEMGALGPVTLQAEDDACDPRQAVAAANKLINEKVTAVIGAYCSSATIPASEPLIASKIFMITPASTSEKVTERGMPFMYRTCGRDDDQSKAAISFMTDHLKAKTVYIIDDKTTYSQGLADNVAKLAAAGGLKVLGHEHVNQGDKDYSAVLTKVKAAKPDVFYVSLQNSASAAPMLIQIARMGIKTKILAQDAVYHPQLMELAKKDAEGVFLTFGYTDKETPSYKKFADAYKKLGEPGAYSAYSYDSTVAYLKAVKAAGSTDPDKVKAELAKLEFDGASKKIKYKENGDSGSNYVIQVVKDGKFTNYWNPENGQLFAK